MDPKVGRQRHCAAGRLFANFLQQLCLFLLRIRCKLAQVHLHAALENVVFQKYRERRDVGIPRIRGLMRMAIVARDGQDLRNVRRNDYDILYRLTGPYRRIGLIDSIELSRNKKDGHDNNNDLYKLFQTTLDQ